MSFSPQSPVPSSTSDIIWRKAAHIHLVITPGISGLVRLGEIPWRNLIPQTLDISNTNYSPNTRSWWWLPLSTCVQTEKNVLWPPWGVEVGETKGNVRDVSRDWMGTHGISGLFQIHQNGAGWGGACLWSQHCGGWGRKTGAFKASRA